LFRGDPPHQVPEPGSPVLVLVALAAVGSRRLLRHADQAMYLARQCGKNIYRFSEPDRP
jgi:hypothetical protein